MDKPEESSILTALKSLVLLGALDTRRVLTPLGRKMAAFPLEPPLARALLASSEVGCTSEVLTIVSVLSSSSKLFVDSHDARDAAADARRKFRHPSGDHLTILNAVRAYEDVAGSESKAGRRDWCRKMYLNERCLAEAINIRAQLRDVCEREQIDWRVSVGDSQGAENAILRAMVQGLVQNTAFLQLDGSYKQVMGQTVSHLRLLGLDGRHDVSSLLALHIAFPQVVKIHPSSSLVDKRVPAIIYDELVRES